MKLKEPYLYHTSQEDWAFIDGSLYFKGCLYIPEDACPKLVADIHESLAGGHGSVFQTLHLLQKDYWWPEMLTFIWKFVTGYAICQSAKVNTHPSIPGLPPLAVEALTPFSSISVNLISGLPLSTGFDSVMVMVNHGLMKGVICCPCTQDIDITGIALLFFHHVFPLFQLSLQGHL